MLTPLDRLTSDMWSDCWISIGSFLSVDTLLVKGKNGREFLMNIIVELNGVEDEKDLTPVTE